jgi:hypothetical protein
MFSPLRSTRVPAGPPALALLLALLALSGCGGDEPPVPADTPISRADEAAATATEGLQLILGIDRVSYPPGAPIQVRIRVMNRMDEPRTVSFSTGQRVDAVLVDEAGNEVVRWSDGQIFTQALGEEHFEPGEEGLSWELDLVAPEITGTYRLRGFLTAVQGTLEASLPVDVTPS